MSTPLLLGLSVYARTNGQLSGAGLVWGAVLTTGFPDLNPARAILIPRERAGFTKSYNPAGFLGNSRDTELRAEPRCTQIGD